MTATYETQLLGEGEESWTYFQWRDGEHVLEVEEGDHRDGVDISIARDDADDDGFLWVHLDEKAMRALAHWLNNYLLTIDTNAPFPIRRQT